MKDVPTPSTELRPVARPTASAMKEDGAGPISLDRTILPAEAQTLHESLCETLRRLRGKKIVLLLNRGNRGDGVIHMGGRQLLQSLGLTWEEVHEPDAPSSISADVLLVIAGGAFCRYTHSIVAVVNRYAKLVEQVVILPASFDLTCAPVRKFAESWTSKYTVFCREQRSFDSLKNANAHARQIQLSHDLAFLADLRRWRERSHAGPVGIFRRDREAVFERRPQQYAGKDISRGPDSEANVLLDYIAEYSIVHTDRTHAAITAAMMGREVWLYRNAYFKNQAIYQHSLSHLANVHFVGDQPFSLRQLSAALYTHYIQRNAYHLRRKWRIAREAMARSTRQRQERPL